jgi:adenylosuccinate lyase
LLDDRDFHDPCQTRAAVVALFKPQATLARIARFEQALAEVQADLGLIPSEAADAILRGAAAWVPDLPALHRHRERVGHPMVAILDALSEAIDPAGQEWLHFGTTTADVFRTVLTGLLHEAARIMDQAMIRIEAQLAGLAQQHRATPMIGRTLGRHALPISFGYKVAGWLTQMRRDCERLAA